jgi:hypothetical protein
MNVPIRGYPDYLVDEDGRIWSNKTNKYLKPAYTNRGYASVELFNDEGSKRILIHRIVATAFIPNPYNYPQINHKDENPKNNSVSNLEWCTAKYNMNYGDGAKKRHNTIDYSKPCYRENAIKNGKKAARPVSMYSLDGQFIKLFKSAADASRQTGIYVTNITRAARTKYNAGGYAWKYERSDDLSACQY